MPRVIRWREFFDWTQHLYRLRPYGAPAVSLAGLSGEDITRPSSLPRVVHDRMFVDLVYSLPTLLVGVIIVALSVGGSIAGLVVFHRYVSIEVRRAHNDVAGFIISVVGVI